MWLFSHNSTLDPYADIDLWSHLKGQRCRLSNLTSDCLSLLLGLFNCMSHSLSDCSGLLLRQWTLDSRLSGRQWRRSITTPLEDDLITRAARSL